MEAKKEEEEATAALLHTVLPPRLEDAGLEDCALPPDSIQEAFLRAATAVNSRATSIFAATTSSDDEEEEEEEEEETPNCINDQWPTAKGVSDSVEGVSSCPDVSDTLVVADPQYPDVSGPCGVEKNGGVVEEGGDKVVVVVVGGGDDVEGREGCVNGLKGLKIKDKVENGGGDEEEEEEERDGDKKPILTQGFV